ncbi:MAG: GntP family permease [bacterium]|nr:GntP family permease [bacterium]MDY2649956.1 GntP family permease [Candidatus Egerieousia sp.]
MSGIALIIIFAAAIAIMVVAISKWHLHPFIAILLTALIFGMVSGIPLPQMTTLIGSGFSKIFAGIGLVIIFGTLMGTILEQSGAALKIADCIIKLLGKRHPVLSMAIMGWVVSIPVFCDSGFVVLNPIREALVKKTQSSPVAMTVALSGGLYLSHVFIPPTPGPLAAAETLGLSGNLLLVMGMGLLCSIFPMFLLILFSNYIGKRISCSTDANTSTGSSNTDATRIAAEYNAIIEKSGKLPSTALSFAPIIVPIILMSLASILQGAEMQQQLKDVVLFLSNPTIALAIGLLFATFLLKRGSGFEEMVENSLKRSGPILFITAAGSVLGNIVAGSPLVGFITDNAQVLNGLGLLFPFLVAAMLKSSMGSSSVAIITAAGIVAPFAEAMGLASPIGLTLICMAVGAGSMTVSHSNDSYFWVVTKFGRMDIKSGYKTQTLATLILGLGALAELYIISLFI